VDGSVDVDDAVWTVWTVQSTSIDGRLTIYGHTFTMT
jgi:hypothetical protein